MKSNFVLALSASPSPTSKTAAIADHVLGLIRKTGVATDHIRVREFDPAALLSGNVGDAAIKRAIELIEQAQGVVVATPVFKSSFSGLLKVALDLLPQFAFAGKVILPLATGGSVAHVLSLDYALRPVLQSMGARHIVQGHFIAEADVTLTDGVLSLSDNAERPLIEAIRNFCHSLTDAEEARYLGHPRPPV